MATVDDVDMSKSDMVAKVSVGDRIQNLINDGTLTIFMMFSTYHLT
jgi:hypothetical protein